MSCLRVLLAEPVRGEPSRLARALRSAPDVDVVGEAPDGAHAVALAARLRPDVIALDVRLAAPDTRPVVQQIMTSSPTPILLLGSPTSLPEEDDPLLAAGAVDLLRRPTGLEPPGTWESRLVHALRMAARVRVLTHPRLRLVAMGAPAHPPVLPKAPRGRYRAIAIGASTGGPGAVSEVLRALPADYPLPILLVLHVGDGGGIPLTAWLDGRSPLRVSLARDGDRLPEYGRGGVFVAPPDHHLSVAGGRLRLSTGAPRHSCRPSVDVLFESVAQDLGSEVVACLLTGMGRDGGEGLLAVRRAGGTTLVQDQITSTIFGMPRHAIALGAAQRVLPLSEIGGAVRAYGA